MSVTLENRFCPRISFKSTLPVSPLAPKIKTDLFCILKSSRSFVSVSLSAMLGKQHPRVRCQSARGHTLYPGGQGLLIVGQKRLTLHSPNPGEVLSHSSGWWPIRGPRKCPAGRAQVSTPPSLAAHVNPGPPGQGCRAGLHSLLGVYLGTAPDPSSPRCNSSIEATSAATNAPSTVGPSIAPPAAPLSPLPARIPHQEVQPEPTRHCVFRVTARSRPRPTEGGS